MQSAIRLSLIQLAVLVVAGVVLWPLAVAAQQRIAHTLPDVARHCADCALAEPLLYTPISNFLFH